MNRTLVVTLGAGTLSAAIIAAATSTAGAAPQGSHSGHGHRTHEVRMLDDCDPDTFPAEAQCTGDGDTTFDEFVEELLEDGEHGKWRNKPEHMTIRHGDTLKARNLGGEPHSFTRVANFGGGCVPDINGLLGLSPVPECNDPASFDTFVGPGGVVTEDEHLHHGSHKYQCLIHPWMRTTVTVR